VVHNALKKTAQQSTCITVPIMSNAQQQPKPAVCHTGAQDLAILMLMLYEAYHDMSQETAPSMVQW
jgi:hypothetical protein